MTWSTTQSFTGGQMMQHSALFFSMGTSSKQDLGISGYIPGHTGLRGLVPQQTGKYCLTPSASSASRSVCLCWQWSTWLWAAWYGYTLSMIWGSNGNVSHRRAGVHHYADWLMVKRCFSVTYLQTGQAILEGHFNVDDQALLLPNDPRHCLMCSLEWRPLAMQPLQQCQD